MRRTTPDRWAWALAFVGGLALNAGLYILGGWAALLVLDGLALLLLAFLFYVGR